MVSELPCVEPRVRLLQKPEGQRRRPARFLGEVSDEGGDLRTSVVLRLDAFDVAPPAASPHLVELTNGNGPIQTRSPLHPHLLGCADALVGVRGEQDVEGLEYGS